MSLVSKPVLLMEQGTRLPFVFMNLFTPFTQTGEEKDLPKVLGVIFSQESFILLGGIF